MENDKSHQANTDIYEVVRSYFRKTMKLETMDYLSDISDPSDHSNLVEVRFKNTHKDFYKNQEGFQLKQGDVVAVEASTGHDIGMVSLTGILAKKQFDRKIRRKNRYNLLNIYRIAMPADLEKWKMAKEKEVTVRNKAREIARNLGLEMKISDAEFQGDNTRVTFYFLADGWVDFRELIKLYAKEFHVKIEMRQIGARQEAAMIGGFSTCGNVMCGSVWNTEFESVKLSAARIQQLPPTGTKLLDHSGKLKSCLNYELDNYVEAWKNMPEKLTEIKTSRGTYYPHKTDVLHNKIWFSTDREVMENPVVLSVEMTKKIIALNKKGYAPPLQQGESSFREKHKFTVGSREEEEPSLKINRNKKKSDRKAKVR